MRFAPFTNIRKAQIIISASNMYPSCLSTHSAIIEHTNKVLYMEDDDIAVVTGGKLSIHRMNRQAGEDPVRAIQTLQMELQQIMKGQLIIKKTVLVYVICWMCGKFIAFIIG